MTDDTPETPEYRHWYGSGSGHGDPDPPPGTPGIQLVGGPLDGSWMVLIDDADPPYPDGLALYADGGAYMHGRSHYEHADPPDGRLHWVYDTA